jgi:hypothetical protein
VTKASATGGGNVSKHVPLWRTRIHASPDGATALDLRFEHVHAGSLCAEGRFDLQFSHKAGKFGPRSLSARDRTRLAKRGYLQ